LHRVSCVTTVDAALAAVQGLSERTGEVLTVKTLQEYHASSDSESVASAS
jgi:carbamoyl-phosphate synthase large subunit